jgi:hypothetical protein
MTSQLRHEQMLVGFLALLLLNNPCSIDALCWSSSSLLFKQQASRLRKILTLEKTLIDMTKPQTTNNFKPIVRHQSRNLATPG